MERTLQFREHHNLPGINLDLSTLLRMPGMPTCWFDISLVKLPVEIDSYSVCHRNNHIVRHISSSQHKRPLFVQSGQLHYQLCPPSPSSSLIVVDDAIHLCFNIFQLVSGVMSKMAYFYPWDKECYARGKTRNLVLPESLVVSFTPSYR